MPDEPAPVKTASTPQPVTRWYKKPVALEARHFDVPPDRLPIALGIELARWCGGKFMAQLAGLADPRIEVPTLEGVLTARLGDWIVKGAHGDFWPVRGDVFAETYEPAGALDPCERCNGSGSEPAAPALVMPADEFAAVKAVKEAFTGPDGKPVPYLTGVSHGWHAVSLPSMDYLRTGPADTVAFAECGELVRVAPKFGAYNRGDVPVTYGPCQMCAWTVAAAAGWPAVQAEVDRLPALAADACRAILEREDAWHGGRDLDDPAVVQLLATVAAHAPVALVSEECAEGECGHGEGRCPSSTDACLACSLAAGDWAGEWQGQLRPECTIKAPCAVLLALSGAAEAGK